MHEIFSLNKLPADIGNPGAVLAALLKQCDEETGLKCEVLPHDSIPELTRYHYMTRNADEVSRVASTTTSEQDVLSGSDRCWCGA